MSSVWFYGCTVMYPHPLPQGDYVQCTMSEHGINNFPCTFARVWIFSQHIGLHQGVLVSGFYIYHVDIHTSWCCLLVHAPSNSVITEEFQPKGICVGARISTTVGFWETPWKFRSFDKCIGAGIWITVGFKEILQRMIPTAFLLTLDWSCVGFIHIWGSPSPPFDMYQL